VVIFRPEGVPVGEPDEDLGHLPEVGVTRTEIGQARCTREFEAEAAGVEARSSRPGRKTVDEVM
jgi:hypothetical protein